MIFAWSPNGIARGMMAMRRGACVGVMAMVAIARIGAEGGESVEMSSSAGLRGFPRFNGKIIACHLARLQFRVALIFSLDENQRPVGVGGQHFRAGNSPAAKLAPIFALTRILSRMKLSSLGEGQF